MHELAPPQASPAHLALQRRPSASNCSGVRAKKSAMCCRGLSRRYTSLEDKCESSQGDGESGRAAFEAGEARS